MSIFLAPLVGSPFVSVILPCYNEERFIAQCLDSIIASDYRRDRMEILVIDGMSSDSTRDIVGRYQRSHPELLRMIDNPLRVKPRALNLGIAASRGDIVIRMDAHATYAPDYVSKCVRHMDEQRADNVGGVRRTLPAEDSLIAKAIAHAVSHPFAAGNATYRTGARTMRWVDTVFGGCYRRNLFDRIGMFNEALTRGQDREFNVRLGRSGGRILFAPDIVCYYYARAKLRGYLNWVYVGGLTPFYITRITRRAIFSWRNLVPLAFVLSLAGSLVSSVLYRPFLGVFLALMTAYLVAATAVSVPVACKEKDLRFMAAMPFVFGATHVAYGIGSVVGLVKPIQRHGDWSST